MTGFHLQGCQAIITGASSGLGVEFARQLAPKATRLWLVARRLPELEQTKTLVLSLNPALQVDLVVADLGTDAGLQSILAAVEGATPNLLINNAGLGDYGRFDDAPTDRVKAQLDVNITGLVLLTHAMLPELARPAGVLNVSSLAGNVFMPELAVYAASKAFVTSFTEALRLEMQFKGVTVAAVCPGPTPTNFGKNARREGGIDTNRSGQDLLRQTPERVVRSGLTLLETGGATVFPGRAVALVATLFRIMPRALLRWTMKRRMKG